MENFGFQELLIIGIVVVPLSIYFIVRFIFRYGKTKGRLEEIEKQQKGKE